MLLLDISQIPVEGTAVQEDLVPGNVHVEGEESFALKSGSLRCRVERGDDRTIHVRGHLEASLGLECGRCLAPFAFPIDQELDLFYLPHGDTEADEEEDDVQLTDRDMVVAYYEGERLDLGAMLREQFFLSIPLKRLCRAECRGLCLACGANRNETACGCPPPPDPRLAPLAKLFEKGS
jgi:uncharacterized protein